MADPYADTAGDPRGDTFSPPSCDAVLREHYWFWQNATEPATKTTAALVANYLTSVGRAANLILNIAPDQTGAVPAPDVAAYAAMGEAVRCLFSRPLAATNSPLAMNGSAMVWELDDGPLAATNVSIVLREELSAGQLIGNFSLACREAGDDAWAPCAMGSLGDGVIPAIPGPGIGHKRILLIAPRGALTGIQLRVDSHFADAGQRPTLRSIELFDWGGDVEVCV